MRKLILARKDQVTIPTPSKSNSPEAATPAASPPQTFNPTQNFHLHTEATLTDTQLDQLADKVHERVMRLQPTIRTQPPVRYTPPPVPFEEDYMFRARRAIEKRLIEIMESDSQDMPERCRWPIGNIATYLHDRRQIDDELFSDLKDFTGFANATIHGRAMTQSQFEAMQFLAGYLIVRLGRTPLG
jgi:hypothetical protein